MEALIPIFGIALLLWICTGSSKDGSSDHRNLRIGRNTDGLFYIYDAETGEVLETFSDNERAKQKLKEMRG